MNKIALSGTPRTDIGGKYAAQLRRNKQVPCVLYGGNNPVHFSVDEAALGKLIFTPDLNGIELAIGGSTTLAMIHEKQFHPTTDRVIHVDFLELDEKKVATATMSVRLKGISAPECLSAKVTTSARRWDRDSGSRPILPCVRSLMKRRDASAGST